VIVVNNNSTITIVINVKLRGDSFSRRVNVWSVRYGTIRYDTVRWLLLVCSLVRFRSFRCCVVLCCVCCGWLVLTSRGSQVGDRLVLFLMLLCVLFFLLFGFVLYRWVCLPLSLSLILITHTHTLITIEWKGITRDCNVSVRFESLKHRCFKHAWMSRKPLQQSLCGTLFYHFEHSPFTNNDFHPSHGKFHFITHSWSLPAHWIPGTGHTGHTGWMVGIKSIRYLVDEDRVILLHLWLYYHHHHRYHYQHHHHHHHHHRRRARSVHCCHFRISLSPTSLLGQFLIHNHLVCCASLLSTFASIYYASNVKGSTPEVASNA